MCGYVELQVTTNFTFLRGASHPEELAQAAAHLGHAAVAITDRNTLAGVVRAHVAAKQAGIRLVVGAHLACEDGPPLLCLPTDRAAYARLTRLLTLGKRAGREGPVPAVPRRCRFVWRGAAVHRPPARCARRGFRQSPQGIRRRL